MNVSDMVEKARRTADSLTAKQAGNEANTKALVIEPVLRGLGWDTSDIDVVEREVQVYDGTFLDYSLNIDGKPRLYVEAKGLNGNLSDKKFIAQSVNYANNSGVVWCVLTNGRRYRVFKSNEVAPMEEKLLFEVDLDDDQPMGRKIEQLGRIARAEVSAGKLDEYGERVFTDSRLRSALAALAADPPAPFLDAVVAQLGVHAVPDAVLRKSLARVLEAASPPDLIAAAPSVPVPPPDSVSPGDPGRPGHLPKQAQYDLDWHLAGKARAMRELWESVDAAIMALGGDVVRRIAKVAMNYFRGKKAMCSAQVRNDRVVVHLKLDPATISPWDDDTLRDVSAIGHWGNGDIEFSLTGEHQIERLTQLIRDAYSKAL